MLSKWEEELKSRLGQVVVFRSIKDICLFGEFALCLTKSHSFSSLHYELAYEFVGLSYFHYDFGCFHYISYLGSSHYG